MTAYLLPPETQISVSRPDLASPRLSPPEMDALSQIHDSDLSEWRSWLARHDITYRPKAGDMRFEVHHLALAAAKHGIGALLLRTRKYDIPEPPRPNRSGDCMPTKSATRSDARF